MKEREFCGVEKRDSNNELGVVPTARVYPPFANICRGVWRVKATMQDIKEGFQTVPMDGRAPVHLTGCRFQSGLFPWFSPYAKLCSMRRNLRLEQHTVT